MTIYYEGAKLTIEWSDDAKSSLEESEALVPPNKSACKRQLDALTKRLGDKGSLRSPDQFRNEDEQIYAIKTRCGLRAYGWFHTKRRGVFVISHYIFKTWKKMKKIDRDRATNNRVTYEAKDND